MTNEELYHHGILGQKWGVRRYQNPDGTLTPEGRKRYGSIESLNAKREKNKKIAKKIAIGVGATVVASAAIYGGIKYSDFVKNKAYDDIIKKGKEQVDKIIDEYTNMPTYDEIEAMPLYKRFDVNKAKHDKGLEILKSKTEYLEKSGRVKDSFVEAQKYLINNKRKKIKELLKNGTI